MGVDPVTENVGGTCGGTVVGNAIVGNATVTLFHGNIAEIRITIGVDPSVVSEYLS